jgi:hypothetical protein
MAWMSVGDYRDSDQFFMVYVYMYGPHVLYTPVLYVDIDAHTAETTMCRSAMRRC